MSFNEAGRWGTYQVPAGGWANEAHAHLYEAKSTRAIWEQGEATVIGRRL